MIDPWVGALIFFLLGVALGFILGVGLWVGLEIRDQGSYTRTRSREDDVI